MAQNLPENFSGVLLDADKVAEVWATAKRHEEETKQLQTKLDHKLKMSQLEKETEIKLSPEERQKRESDRFYTGINEKLLQWHNIKCSWWQPHEWRFPIEQEVLTSVQRRTDADVRDKFQDAFTNYNCSAPLFHSVMREFIKKDANK